MPGLLDHIKDLQKQADGVDPFQSKQAKAALNELGVSE